MIDLRKKISYSGAIILEGTVKEGLFSGRATYDTENGRTRGLVGTTMLHFINDLHPSFLATFLPILRDTLGLSHAQSGFLSTFFGTVNLFLQPVAGHFADGMRSPSMAVWAPLLTALGAYLLPSAPNYGIALLFTAMISIGTSSFHPQGHGLTGVAGGTQKLGLCLAVFSCAGTLGSALSPVYGVFLYEKVGPAMMPFAMIPVLITVLAARMIMPRTREIAADRTGDGKKMGFFAGITHVFAITLPLIVISTIRDSTSQGIRVFLPLLVSERGGSLAAGGMILFAFTAAGSVANLIGGRMADKFGRRKIIIAMMLLTPAFLLPAVQMEGLASLVLFVLGGTCIAATNPITLALAQEAAPESRSTVSSLVMGVSWGVANIVASPIGYIADHYGLKLTLSVVALSPLLIVVGMIPGLLRGKE